MSDLETISSQGRLAFVAARWHADLIESCRAEFLAESERLGTPAARSTSSRCPAPSRSRCWRKLARSGRYDAIVACGLVVNGGIYRHEFVGAAVIDGLMRVQLDTEVPVMSAVLTPRDFHEHETTSASSREHFVKKGVEVAQACLETIAGLRRCRPERQLIVGRQEVLEARRQQCLDPGRGLVPVRGLEADRDEGEFRALVAARVAQRRNRADAFGASERRQGAGKGG